MGTTTLNELADRVQQLVKPEIPTTLMDKMKRLPDLMKMASFPPKSVRTGICQQVVLEGDNADLRKLPIDSMLAFGWERRLWTDLPESRIRNRKSPNAQIANPHAGRYITFGGIHTRNADTGDAQHRHVTKCQMFAARKAAMPLAHAPRRVHDISACTRTAAKRCPWPSRPAASRCFRMCAAPAPLPGIEELLFAGFLNNGGIELVKCRTIDLEVPGK